MLFVMLLVSVNYLSNISTDPWKMRPSCKAIVMGLLLLPLLVPMLGLLLLLLQLVELLL
jgi:hypothetical protein